MRKWVFLAVRCAGLTVSSAVFADSTLEIHPGSEDVNLFSISPDGQFMIVKNHNEDVLLWNLKLGELMDKQSMDQDLTSEFIFDLNYGKKQIIVKSVGGSSKVLDFSSGKLNLKGTSIDTSNCQVETLASDYWADDVFYSPDGKYFFVRSNSYQTHVYDSFGHFLYVTGPVREGRITADSKYLVTKMNTNSNIEGNFC